MIRIKNGKQLFSRLFDAYLHELYEYNSKLPDGIMLKPFHYVKSKGKTYLYVGKYYYKAEKVKGRVRWKYLGKVPPEGCPPPPPNPFDGFSARVEGEDLIVREEVYERYLKKFLEKGEGDK